MTERRLKPSPRLQSRRNKNTMESWIIPKEAYSCPCRCSGRSPTAPGTSPTFSLTVGAVFVVLLPEHFGQNGLMLLIQFLSLFPLRARRHFLSAFFLTFRFTIRNLIFLPWMSLSNLSTLNKTPSPKKKKKRNTLNRTQFPTVQRGESGNGGIWQMETTTRKRKYSSYK